MKYLFMQEHGGACRVRVMCRALRVSRSGYYAWVRRGPSERERANRNLLGQIKAAHIKSRRLYGSPRIAAELNEQGIVCGKNRVARLMREHRIQADVKRSFKKTTESKHDYALAANLLIDKKQTESLWASDITFVPTREGWLYVSAIMDVGTRKIIGLGMRERLDQGLTTSALRQAVARRKPPEGLIHHSDRGRQYASHEYQGLLEHYGIRQSMSRSGNCYDNAYMESFFGTLKTELVHGERYRSRKEARLSIFEYVEVFYNRIRRHSALGYRSPEQYERLLLET